MICIEVNVAQAHSSKLVEEMLFHMNLKWTRFKMNISRNSEQKEQKRFIKT